MSKRKSPNGRALLTAHCDRLLKGGQQELAATLKITPNYLSLLKNGSRRPSLALAQRIKKAIGIEVSTWQ
jgi:transcriptional regulator with XRE-family HTH domain